MKLIDETVRGFRVAKIFRENSDRVSSINFSANGETLISSSDDDSIVIYDCLNGTWVLLVQLYSTCSLQHLGFFSFCVSTRSVCL